MDTKVGVAGWVLAVVFAVGAVCLFAYEQNVATELAQVKTDSEAVKSQVEALKATLAQKDEAVRNLEGKLAKLEASGSVEGNASDSAGGPAAMLKGMMGGGEGGSNPMQEMGKMFQGEKGKEFAKQAAGMSINMGYGEMFSELNLPDDVEQRVRDILASGMADEISAGFEDMEKGSMGADRKKRKDEANAKIKAELAKELSPEELAVWEEYASTMDERMVGQSVDMQLGMFAPGLTEESRALTREVMVDELMALENADLPAGGDPMQAGVNAQQQALSRARERLAEELDETQLAEVDRFFQQMQQMTEMALQMMKPKEQETKQ